MRARSNSLHERYKEHCKWDAAAKDLPTQFLDSGNGLLGAQQLVTRNRDDACHADMLSSFDLDTTQGQHDAATHRSSSGGPAGAFLIAIPGGRTTLGNYVFVVLVGSLCGCGTAWCTVLPPTWPPRRENAVQELQPKQIIRWYARR